MCHIDLSVPRLTAPLGLLLLPSLLPGIRSRLLGVYLHLLGGWQYDTVDLAAVAPPSASQSSPKAGRSSLTAATEMVPMGVIVIYPSPVSLSGGMYPGRLSATGQYSAGTICCTLRAHVNSIFGPLSAPWRHRGPRPNQIPLSDHSLVRRARSSATYNAATPFQVARAIGRGASGPSDVCRGHCRPVSERPPHCISLALTSRGRVFATFHVHMRGQRASAHPPYIQEPT